MSLTHNAFTDLASDVSVGDSTITVNKASGPFNDPPSPADRAPLVLTDSTANPSKLEIITYTGRTDNGDGTWDLTGVTKNAFGGHGDQSWTQGDPAFQSPLATFEQWELATNSVSSDTTLTRSDHGKATYVDASGGAITITLPDPVDGFLHTIKKTDSSGNSVTVDGANSADSIDGSGSQSLGSQNKFIVVRSDGSNWFIEGSN